MNKLGIIGLGHLATAFVTGLRKTGAGRELEIGITTLDEENKKRAEEKLNCTVFRENRALVEASDVVLIAVKPDQTAAVLEEICDVLQDHQTVMSFVAGFSLEDYQRILPGRPIIKVIPNIAMAVGESFNCIVANDKVASRALKELVELMDLVGTSMVIKEHQMDLLTSVTSSGIGFVAYMMDAFIKASIDRGLLPEAAEAAVVQTFLGATQLLRHSSSSAKELASQVATKGGATREGLDVLEEHHLDQTIAMAIEQTIRKIESLK